MPAGDLTSDDDFHVYQVVPIVKVPKCPKCGDEMHTVPLSIKTTTKTYQHQCVKCGAYKWFDQAYPLRGFIKPGQGGGGEDAPIVGINSVIEPE